MNRKPIEWIGTSLKRLREFPEIARIRAGQELNLVQHGAVPTDFKPMPSVGVGAYEIRIHTGDAFRVFYVAKFPEAVYVLHAFDKKTRKTSHPDLEIGQQNYAEMLKKRRNR